jgi:hypothetical protein
MIQAPMPEMPKDASPKVREIYRAREKQGEFALVFLWGAAVAIIVTACAFVAIVTS